MRSLVCATLYEKPPSLEDIYIYISRETRAFTGKKQSRPAVRFREVCPSQNGREAFVFRETPLCFFKDRDGVDDGERLPRRRSRFVVVFFLRKLYHESLCLFPVSDSVAFGLFRTPTDLASRISKSSLFGSSETHQSPSVSQNGRLGIPNRDRFNKFERVSRRRASERAPLSPRARSPATCVRRFFS